MRSSYCSAQQELGHSWGTVSSLGLRTWGQLWVTFREAKNRDNSETEVTKRSWRNCISQKKFLKREKDKYINTCCEEENRLFLMLPVDGKGSGGFKQYKHLVQKLRKALARGRMGPQWSRLPETASWEVFQEQVKKIFFRTGMGLPSSRTGTLPKRPLSSPFYASVFGWNCIAFLDRTKYRRIF